MYILIIGGGKVGFYLAKELADSSHEVLIIEQQASKVAEINETLGEIAMRGDGCEAAIQERAGAGRADLLLAVTGEDEDNLIACQVARHLFKVPRMVARINNPKNELVFRALGIDFTVSATTAIMSHIEQELPTHSIISLLTLRRGFEVVEIRIPEESGVSGRPLRDVLLPQQALVWGIVDTEGNPKSPSPDTILHAGDEVVAVTLKESEDALRAALTRPPVARSF